MKKYIITVSKVTEEQEPQLINVQDIPESIGKKTGMKIRMQHPTSSFYHPLRLSSYWELAYQRSMSWSKLKAFHPSDWEDEL